MNFIFEIKQGSFLLQHVLNFIYKRKNNKKYS